MCAQRVSSRKNISPCMWQSTKPMTHGSSRLQQQGPDDGVTQFETSLRQLVLAPVQFFCEQLGVEMRSRTCPRRTIWHLAHQISQLQPGLSLTLPVTLLEIHTVEGHFILSGSPSNLFAIHYLLERRAWCHLLDLFAAFLFLLSLTAFFFPA